MPEPLTIALLIVVVAVIIFVVRRASMSGFTIRQTVPVVSSVDGMEYRVHISLPDPVAAADTLATINSRLVAILRHLKKKYPATSASHASQFPQRTAVVSKLLNRYNPDNLAENSPMNSENDTSYTIDKGRLVAFCLRSKKGTPLIHQIDIITFVAIHELAHIGINAVDHPPEFWSTFKFLLGEAAEARDVNGKRVFENRDYKLLPEKYCGLDVNYNPFYDVGTSVIV